eukprot:7387034-Prymnesium_polylepis.2
MGRRRALVAEWTDGHAHNDDPRGQLHGVVDYNVNQGSVGSTVNSGCGEPRASGPLTLLPWQPNL